VGRLGSCRTPPRRSDTLRIPVSRLGSRPYLTLVGRLRSGVRVSTSFQVFALKMLIHYAGVITSDSFLQEGNLPRGLSPKICLTVLVTGHLTGACMLTYDLSRHSMKAVSTRWRLQAGCVLVTSAACFVLSVEPGCIVLWRLKDDDDVAFKQYMDNQHPADDLHDDDHHFCYVHDDNDVSDKQVPVLSLSK